jgi:hypothetical protein
MSIAILIRIIIATIVATSAMTLFSYIVSASAKELYKEPVLIAYILNKLQIEIAPEQKIILGWLLHYCIGFCFVVVYHYLWFYEIMKMSWSVAFIFGILSGIIGILGWIILFKISPQQPKINFKGYYIQLLIAHIVFAVVAFAVYKQSMT